MNKVFLLILILSFSLLLFSRANLRTVTLVQTPINKDNATLSLSEMYPKIARSIVQVIYSNVSKSNATAPNSNLLYGTNSIILSGFVYDKVGHIITHAHGLTGSVPKIDVTFLDGVTYPASVTGFDPGTSTAVLELKNVPKDQLFPLPIGNSTELSVGDQVAAIGSHFGLSGSLNAWVV